MNVVNIKDKFEGGVKKDPVFRYFVVAIGAVLYTLGFVFFITPHKLYSGGVMGFAQLIRSVVTDIAGVAIPKSFDLSGIIFYAINIPLFLMAYKDISRTFFLKTLLATTLSTILISVIPEQTPILDDRLTSVIIGGIISGMGVGLMLKHGGSGGGLDILGVYMTKKYRSASVGKFCLLCNIVLYISSALLFNVDVAIYSIIYSVANTMTVDRIHTQNIMVEATIFTKVDGIDRQIIEKLGRGVTEWDGHGAYTGESEHIMMTVVSKYEVARLKSIISSIDPNAFITISSVNSVFGNFKKRLEE